MSRFSIVAFCLLAWLCGAAGAAEALSAANAAGVNQTPLAVEPVVAFPNLRWTGWEADKDGVPQPLRPILLTHAGDGSNRIFVPEQQGIVHVFTPDSTVTQIFLDLSEKVHY
ncbi:MAG: glucose sorbosone dehydrogenase, partial [Chloroflexota bacterium]